MTRGFNKLQVATVRDFEFVDEKRIHPHKMAWIFIPPTIPVSWRDPHWKRTGRDHHHWRAVFARRRQERDLKRFVGCEENEPVDVGP
jgi:hypothetical protein